MRKSQGGGIYAFNPSMQEIEADLSEIRGGRVIKWPISQSIGEEMPVIKVIASEQKKMKRDNNTTKDIMGGGRGEG